MHDTPYYQFIGLLHVPLSFANYPKMIVPYEGQYEKHTRAIMQTIYTFTIPFFWPIYDVYTLSYFLMQKEKDKDKNKES